MGSSTGRRRGHTRSAASNNLPSDSPEPLYDHWAWWPNQLGRRSPAQEEFLDLTPKAQGELVDRMARFREGRTRFKDVDDLGDGIKEIRVQIGNNHFRVLFCVLERVPVALTCFYKNQRRTEKKDLDRAKRRMKNY